MSMTWEPCPGCSDLQTAEPGALLAYTCLRVRAMEY